MTDAVIRTEAVSKVYKTGDLLVNAVKDVSLEIHAGEFVALVGPSGSGKTTMLAILAALLSPTQGKVIIDGRNLQDIPENERVKFRRERIGFTFQANNLVPYLNVLENVGLMLRLNGTWNSENQERAVLLLKRLGMGDRLKNLPGQLSGGQMQRVAIARSLIHRPSVVLADEPTASLDTERAFQVVQIFSDLIHEQQKAGIMVTHDLRMVKYVDKVYQMMDGELASIVDDRDEIEAMASGGIGFAPFIRHEEPLV
jgi:putative ABC transport system ATP-binding protein